jgi:hypothetical protein
MRAWHVVDMLWVTEFIQACDEATSSVLKDDFQYSQDILVI